MIFFHVLFLFPQSHSELHYWLQGRKTTRKCYFSIFSKWRQFFLSDIILNIWYSDVHHKKLCTASVWGHKDHGYRGCGKPNRRLVVSQSWAVNEYLTAQFLRCDHTVQHVESVWKTFLIGCSAWRITATEEKWTSVPFTTSHQTYSLLKVAINHLWWGSYNSNCSWALLCFLLQLLLVTCVFWPRQRQCEALRCNATVVYVWCAWCVMTWEQWLLNLILAFHDLIKLL